MNQIDIDLKETRSTVINWPNQIRQIVDGYRSYHTIGHGVQKDAIQNAWDARIDKKNAQGWEIEFELLQSVDMILFSWIDKGTTGLTGRILLPEDLEKDLPVEERWGRFENVAFTKEPSERALGARGRGKFIFLGASKHIAKSKGDKKIGNLLLYDTLRDDGVYRCGFRTITITDSPIQAFEGIEAKEKLVYFSRNLLQPLKSIGTRVIIVDPVDELVDDVKNGKFREYIEETWWEILRDHHAKISIKNETKNERAKLSEHFNFPENDSKRFKCLQKRNIKLPSAPNYLIKNLHIVYDSEKEISEDLRGIFIQRGGMKICSLPIKYLDKSYANSIYGYINFDENLERKLQEDEGIEHYSFDYKKLFPRLVKQFIEDECDKFIRQKLGIDTGSKSKNYEKERSAELKAIYQINKIAVDLGIVGKGLYKKPDSGNGERIVKPLRLSFGKFVFPSESLRINYGQFIKSINLGLVNDTKYDHQVGIRFSVLYDEQEEVLNFINNKDFQVKAASSLKLINDFEMNIKQDIFRYKGKYTFFAKLVSLKPERRGEILHQISKHFWVEENPPQKGIFEDIEAIEYPEEKKHIMGLAYKSDGGGYIFSYNSIHPAKQSVEDDEDDLMKYLIELMCLELVWIDLRNIDSKIFSLEEKENPEQIVRGLTKFLGKVKYKIT